MTTVCLFASASDHLPQSARAAAEEFGRACAEARITVVYGGSHRGLMGAVASAAYSAGGEVIGVMLRSLMDREQASPHVSIPHVVETLADRKRLMAELCDAFVALPGGIGTLDEVTEMMTWYDIGAHQKPVLLCNIDGFWDPFVRLMHHFDGYGVLRSTAFASFQVVANAAEAVAAIEGLSATSGIRATATATSAEAVAAIEGLSVASPLQRAAGAR